MPLKHLEYKKVKISDKSEEIIEEYIMWEWAQDRHVHFWVDKGVYGLSQSGANIHDELKEKLYMEGYYRSPLVPTLWKHKTRHNAFMP